jgi:hypothetical protein
MSDTTEMVRLIRHAAELLRSAIDKEKVWSDGSTEDQLRRSGTIAAAATAQATLALVAACMEPESEPNAKALARVRDLIDRSADGPYVRVDELLDAIGGAS